MLPPLPRPKLLPALPRPELEPRGPHCRPRCLARDPCCHHRRLARGLHHRPCRALAKGPGHHLHRALAEGLHLHRRLLAKVSRRRRRPLTKDPRCHPGSSLDRRSRRRPRSHRQSLLHRNLEKEIEKSHGKKSR
ncbi:hypothetical protein GUJ93_ZPchr0012g21811 [Zizania palustris]|uniref:Uncharacterized protein n=1 Tax=Zizania palustris TaxID=103762 RepID=A0A8J5WTH3_ZIZPA|nr:hypothetical protein GUJ93_ZPchr0012g21811 [Zizania palustris]